MDQSSRIKVLHVVAGSIQGGAAKGALNLHLGLREIGISSRLLVQNGGYEGEDGVYSLNGGAVRTIERKLVNGLEKGLFGYFGKQKGQVFSSGQFGQRITSHSLFEWADIINLHWVTAGMLNLRQIEALEKPVVWTMRDMWPFTGGCHYSMGCMKYTTGCGNCPMLKRAGNNDVSSWGAHHKSKILSKPNFHFVGITEWVTNSFLESYVAKGVKNSQVSTIDNCIEDQSFFPEPVLAVRTELGLPLNSKIVLSGAVNNNSLYKGGSYLSSILTRIQNRQDVEVVVFGSAENKVEGCRYVGYIKDDAVLRKYYSAADVFVAASVQEAFGKTIAESMACGTPVVAFNDSGPATMINHAVDGMLADPHSIQSFVDAINSLLNLKPDVYAGFAKKSIEKVRNKFTKTKAANSYKDLYARFL